MTRSEMGSDPDVLEERDVAAWMRQLAAVPLEPSATDASQLWWKAEMLRRWDTQRRAVAPIDIGERVVVLIALLAAVALFRWTWEWLSTSGTAVPAGTLEVAWTAMIASFILLGVAAVCAFRTIVHSEIES